MSGDVPPLAEEKPTEKASFGTDLRHGLKIGRIEFIRSVRALRENRRQLIGIIIGAGFLALFSLFGIPAVYDMGATLRTPGGADIVSMVSRLMNLVVGGLLALFALRTAEKLNRIEHQSLMLTVVTPRATLIGLLVAEIARLFAYLGPPIVILYLSFVVGTQSLLTAIVIVVVLLPVVGSLAVIGYILGLSISYVAHRLPISTRSKAILWPILFLVFFISSQLIPAIAADGGLPIIGEAWQALGSSPLTDYGKLLLVGLPAAPAITPIAGVLAVGFVVSIPVGFTVAARIARRLWFGDEQESGGSDPVETSGDGFGRSRTPRPLRWFQAGRIAWLHLVCVSRSPRQMLHLTFPLIIAGSTIVPLFETLDVSSAIDQILRFGPLLVPILGALFGGAALCLNPLGDEKDMLPALVLTAVDTRELVAARVVTALVIGFPFAILVPIVLGVLSPASLLEVVFQVIFGILLVVASACIALGIGTAAPRYKATKTFGVEVISPSYPVTFGHAVSVGILGIVGIVVLPESFSQSLIPFGGYVFGLVVVTIIGYQYALRRFRNYRID